MTVKQAAERFDFTVVAGASELGREITGVYTGDLLSWVMARLKDGDAWITIQGHINSVAVACLTGAACVIVAEGAEVAPDVAAKADKEEMPVLKTGLSAYETAKLFAGDY